MKKWVSILFLSLYTIAVSGISVQIHYCMGKVESIALALSDDTDYSCCDSENDDVTNTGCCGNEQLTPTIDDESTASQWSFDFQAKWLLAPHAIATIPSPVERLASVVAFKANHGPPWQSSNLYLRHRNFRC